MPGKGGRPQSLWWSHFQMVGGQVFKKKHPFLHQRSPLRLIFNGFCHSGLKTCFSWMRTQLSEQDRYFRSLLRWNMRHWGDQSTMMLKKTIHLYFNVLQRQSICDEQNIIYIRLSFYWGGKVDVSVCVCFSPIPLLSDQEVFFSMTFFTWIDFNNARISCQKTLIFELYSMFLVIITFAFLHPFIDNSQESYAKIKNQGKNYFI